MTELLKFSVFKKDRFSILRIVVDRKIDLVCNLDRQTLKIPSIFQNNWKNQIKCKRKYENFYANTIFDKTNVVFLCQK